MASDVKVVINLKQPTGKLGFGYPLIFVGVAEKAVAYTECANLEAVVTAGFTEGTNAHTAAKRIFAQTNAPAKIAICATTENAVTGLATIINKEWRQLIVASAGAEGESTLAEISAYIEGLKGANTKMYFASTADLTAIKEDVAKCTRTAVMYYTNAAEVCPEAAFVGETAGKDAGSFTYKNQILKDLKPLEFTDTKLSEIHAKNCFTFVTKAGDNVTTEGKVLSGEYIDIIDSKDYVISQMTYQLQKTLNNYDKINYDNSGIALLESICVNVLQDAFNNGIIATNAEGTADYTVSFAARENTKEEDRRARKYLEGRFSFRLLGAIHEIEVTGTIEV